MQRGNYNSGPDDFWIGNMPQLIAKNKDGKEIISDPGKFLPIKDKKGFWTLDKVKFQFDAKNYPAAVTGEACFSDSYKKMVGVKDMADYQK
jgi:hypothetical protein